MNIERDIMIAERVASLEVKEEELRTDITSIKEDMSKLVGEVQKIRTALYFMGAMIAANAPALQTPFKILTAFLGF